MRTVTVADFHAALQDQGVPLQHVAVRCPVCGTIQSPQDLIDHGAGPDYASVRCFIGFSCVGRWAGTTPQGHGWPPGKGCDWSFGGLLLIRTYEVVTPDGRRLPMFEPVTPAEARLHMARRKQICTQPRRLGMPAAPLRLGLAPAEPQAQRAGETIG